MSDQSRPIALVNLDIADDPSSWNGIGFSVFSRQVCVGETTLRLGKPGTGIVGWSLSGTDQATLIELREGIPTESVEFVDSGRKISPVSLRAHANSAILLDHIVL
ncbi:MAG: hypothetical protein ACC652_05675, partial [Acidimicrobiales bacterium]